MRRRTVLASLGAVAAAPAFASPQPRVFAAASVAAVVQAALGEAGLVVAGASGALARQIEQGAPADLFFSADPIWMDRLAAAGLILPESRRDLLGNSLVLIAPRSRPVRLRTLSPAGLEAALGPRGRLALPDPDYVPAGRYGRAALQALGGWEAARERLALCASVADAVALVVRGEAALGVAYATDARAEPRVSVAFAVPASAHPRIVYPLALLRRAAGSAPARTAYARLVGQPALARYREAGFLVL
jgi:molybdate transport system substrate-binding protein